MMEGTHQPGINGKDFINDGYLILFSCSTCICERLYSLDPMIKYGIGKKYERTIL